MIFAIQLVHGVTGDSGRPAPCPVDRVSDPGREHVTTQNLYRTIPVPENPWKRSSVRITPVQ